MGNIIRKLPFKPGSIPTYCERTWCIHSVPDIENEIQSTIEGIPLTKINNLSRRARTREGHTEGIDLGVSIVYADIINLRPGLRS